MVLLDPADVPLQVSECECGRGRGRGPTRLRYITTRTSFELAYLMARSFGGEKKGACAGVGVGERGRTEESKVRKN